MNDTLFYGYTWIGYTVVAVLALLTFFGVYYYKNQCSSKKT